MPSGQHPLSDPWLTLGRSASRNPERREEVLILTG
jgi:hypothetical protein